MVAAAMFLAVGCGASEEIDGPSEVENATYPTVANLSKGPYVFGGDISPDRVAVLEVAAEEINAAVGFEAVAIDPGNYFTPGQVVNEVSPTFPDAVASAKRDRASGNCVLFFWRDASMLRVGSPRGTVDPIVAAHEMAHCLGLAHDEEDEDSIMFPLRTRGQEQFVTQGMINSIRKMRKP